MLNTNKYEIEQMVKEIETKISIQNKRRYMIEEICFHNFIEQI